ncbi:hypothetical protein CCAX7_008110 [Capsulimonas corticalis]|uniref:Uncharacterized protein n=1 Tax=Capsulimonas corticalis TaxID=2219043 RepID=A0A402CTV6_9BACT|nr:DUF1579 family protein [Capsulimonas corticalis]BDI28760.1 hypothetical protein CCAX7_008110 [Capsulimonas corticalis]
MKHMTAIRTFAALAVLTGGLTAHTLADAPQPVFLRNNQPGAMHQRLNALVGDWSVRKFTYIIGGAPSKPLVADSITCHREWIAGTGGRHLLDITQGPLGKDHYYRMGVLSYSTMDKRYEWNTVDMLNTMMMTYKGAQNSGAKTGDIVMRGEFTDAGLLGDKSVGKTIKQRTVIHILSPDRHVFDLYFTPPGGKERLIDHAVYTRRK